VYPQSKNDALRLSLRINTPCSKLESFSLAIRLAHDAFASPISLTSSRPKLKLSSHLHLHSSLFSNHFLDNRLGSTITQLWRPTPSSQKESSPFLIRKNRFLSHLDNFILTQRSDLYKLTMHCVYARNTSLLSTSLTDIQVASSNISQMLVRFTSRNSQNQAGANDSHQTSRTSTQIAHRI
jgi:hypothetical protein